MTLHRRQFRGSPPYTDIPSLGEDDIVFRLFEIDGRIEIAVDDPPTGFTGKYSLRQRELPFLVPTAGTPFAGRVEPGDLPQLNAEFCTGTF